MLATKLLKSAGLTWADVLGLAAASGRGRKSDLPGKKARQERASFEWRTCSGNIRLQARLGCACGQPRGRALLPPSKARWAAFPAWPLLSPYP